MMADKLYEQHEKARKAAEKALSNYAETLKEIGGKIQSHPDRTEKVAAGRKRRN
jgi:hypothetical protein